MNQTSINLTVLFHSRNNTLSFVSLSYLNNTLSFVFSFCFFLLFSVGGLLDIFVLYVMVRSGQLRMNLSSFLIFHLSFTHMLFHVVFAMTVPDGPLRENNFLMCKMSALIEHACPAAIFSTLVAIAWDRQKNILQPFKSLVAKSVKSYLLMVAFIWTYAVVSSVLFVYSARVQSKYLCKMVNNNTLEDCEEYKSCFTPSDWKMHTSETIYFVVAFLIPLAYMLVAYTKIAVRLYKRSREGMIHRAVAKHKTKSIRLLVAAVLGLVICWGPSVSLNLLDQYLVRQSFDNKLILVICFKFIAPASSSCVNTAIYAYFSPEFRKNCIKFGCCCCSSCTRFLRRCCRCRRVRRVRTGGTVSDRAKESCGLEMTEGRLQVH